MPVLAVAEHEASSVPTEFLHLQLNVPSPPVLSFHVIPYAVAQRFDDGAEEYVPPFEMPQVPGVAGGGSLVAEQPAVGSDARQYQVY